MYAHINHGDRMVGLMSYLAGPGRREEHTRPHIVAGDAGVMSWYADGVLDHAKAVRVAKYLERPAKVTDGSVTVPVYERVAGGRDAHGVRVLERQKVGEKPGHVYQVAMSVRAEEGDLGDDVWRRIAEEFVDRMDLAKDGDPVRWAAVHHGRSAGGNDHIHIVVNLVREDGTAVGFHNDFRRAKQVCRELEADFGLMPLEPNEYELTRSTARTEWETNRHNEQATPGVNPRIPWDELDDHQQRQLMADQVGDPGRWARIYAQRDVHAETPVAARQQHQGSRESLGRARARAEYEKRRRDGEVHVPWERLTKERREALTNAAMPVEDPKTSLARIVRGASVASADEAEFVRRLRAQGVLVRPRFAKGRTDVVEGFSVALRPAAGERPTFRGGSTLAADLSLPRLRANWPDTADSAQAAVAEWTAAKKHRRPVKPGREAATPAPQMWAKVERDMRFLREQLRQVQPGDYAAWAKVARESAGALAAWSNRIEETPGPLAATSDLLARSAETTREAQRALREQREPKVVLPSISGAAYLLLAAGGTGPAAELAVLKALLNLTKALHDMHETRQAALRAQRIEQTVRGQMLAVVQRLQAVEATAGERTSSTREGGTAVLEKPAAARPTTTAETTQEIDPRAAEAARLRRATFGDQGPSRKGPAPAANDPGQGTPARREGPQRPGQTPGKKPDRGLDR